MVPIYPGLQVPQQNPTITGNTFGQVWVFATAPNYAGDAALVNVTETATMPAAETIPVGQTTNVVLTLSAPAVARHVLQYHVFGTDESDRSSLAQRPDRRRLDNSQHPHHRSGPDQHPGYRHGHLHLL